MNPSAIAGALRFRAASGVCLGAFVVHAALGLMAHHALRTNGFDLSVFDYALWTTASGGPFGYVPMFQQSLFAQHFMPTLVLLAPLSRVFDTPAYLIVVQTLFHAVAAYLLFRFAERYVSRPVALALMAAFLFSRRVNIALMSFFYIESAEPMLIFGALLAWSSGRRTLYWVVTVLALGCKEDVAIYFLAFGLLLVITKQDRTTGLQTTALAVAWLLFAVFVAIPYWRDVYGLGNANPFFEERYGFPIGNADLATLLGRLLSIESFGKLVTLTGATLFLCLLSPGWFAVAIPGIALNLATVPGSGQAGLNGHYLWPILPWVFAAAVFGAQRVPTRIVRWLPAVIVLVTVADAPVPRSLAGARWRAMETAAPVLSQLRTLTPSGTIVAQPNLIPHLSRQMTMYGLRYSAGQPRGDYVLLTEVGDRWPLTPEDIAQEVASLQADAQYEQITKGPLITFRRRQ